MTTSDFGEAAPPEAIDLSLVRSRILETAPEPAEQSVDFARLTGEARWAIEHGELPPQRPEVRVRLFGDGVHGHTIAVHTAMQLLDSFQGAVTAVGSAMRRLTDARPSAGPDGKPIGIKKLTELKMNSNIGAGSVVFFLEGSAPPPLAQDGLVQTASDGFVDEALRSLLRVLETAQEDDPDDPSQLVEQMQRFGVQVASKLDALAEQAINNGIDVDLGLRSTGGRRAQAVLGRRGAAAIRYAVERNKTRSIQETILGRLRTVSDGADKIRVTLDDDITQIKMGVEPDVGVTLGPLLGRRVVAEVETTITWKLATGKERRTYKLLTAEPVSELSTDV
ncbi:hypothetical protein ACWEOZ_37100 [Actinoplanes sp. NPDC004185]